MIKNYITTALRNLVKNKLYSFIIIAGLCIGISSCLLIILYIKNELSYDTFFDKKDRIARVIMEYNMGGNTTKGNYTSTKVGPSFKSNFPEIEEFVRLSNSNRLVKYRDKVFVEKRFLYADSTFFDVFNFRSVYGNLETALAKPNSIVLTQTSAKKYFGDSDPVGKTLQVSTNGVDYMVTGVMEDCPANSHIKFDFLASFSSLGLGTENTYWNANYNTYLLLRDEASIATLQEKIPGFMKKEMKEVFSGSDYLTYELEPLLKIHLYSEQAGFEPNGSITYVYMIGVIAFLILTIACFTFINLATAKSVERAKEIGIRKVTGAEKTQIFWQFIGESFVIVAISACLSFFITYLCLPQFNELMNRNLDFSFINPGFVFVVLLMLIFISFLGGAYPALILSKFQLVKVLKGSFKNTGKGILLRRSLFVFQFVISAFLIISAIIIQQQLSFIQSKKLGFDKDHVVILPTDALIVENFSTLKTELKKSAGVIAVSAAHFEPSSILGGYNMSKPGMEKGAQFAVNAGGVDEEYIKTNQIRIIAGEDLTKRDVADATQEDNTKNYFHFILNEKAAKEFGWTPQQAIGEKMFLDESRPGIVKAVVEDFHFSSIHNPIKPLVLFPDNYPIRILVRLAGNNMAATLSQIENTWKQTVKHRPFEYAYVKDNYNKMYRSEMQLGKAVNVFTVIGIILACMGLFGLSSYNIQQRTKEIGILKVLGAPVLIIVSKLTRNFIYLVLLSVIIASPLAWITMSKWLQNFSYKIEINIWVFAGAGIASLLIAAATISIRSLKAALANPVKSLRTE